MSTLTTAAHDTPDGAVLEITGALDFDTVDRFRAALNRLELPPGGQLVLDLGGLTFCDSSGITAFLAARNHARAAGAGIALAAVPGNTARILRIAGLDTLFARHPDAATALAARAPSPPAALPPER